MADETELPPEANANFVNPLAAELETALRSDDEDGVASAQRTDDEVARALVFFRCSSNNSSSARISAAGGPGSSRRRSIDLTFAASPGAGAPSGISSRKGGPHGPV